MQTKCNQCESINIDEIDGYNTCTDCGCMDIYHPKYILSYKSLTNGSMVYKSKIVYKRLDYFTELLKCMTVRKINYDKCVIKFVNKIKQKKKKYNLKTLKRLMKQNNLQMYNKYLYSIYYLIYDKKLINISLQKYNMLINDFKKLNRLYKLKVNKRNMINYKLVMFQLFKTRKISTKYLLLPKSFINL
jgi:hypothetical protein